MCAEDQGPLQGARPRERLQAGRRAELCRGNLDYTPTTFHHHVFFLLSMLLLMMFELLLMMTVVCGALLQLKGKIEAVSHAPLQHALHLLLAKIYKRSA